MEIMKIDGKVQVTMVWAQGEHVDCRVGFLEERDQRGELSWKTIPSDGQPSTRTYPMIYDTGRRPSAHCNPPVSK